MKLALSAILAVAVLGCVDEDPEIAQEELALNAPLKIYMSPTGLTTCEVAGSWDPTCGLSQAKAVKYLYLVHDILDHLDFDDADGGLTWTQEHDANVEVHIDPTHGVYYENQITWTIANPAYSITFMPLDNNGRRPRFVGCLESNPSLCAIGNLIRVERNGWTNIHFRKIQIERYSNGLEFKNEGDPSYPNGGNSVEDCYLYQIGDTYTDASAGTGAVIFQNSIQNVVTGTTFTNIENDAPNESRLHAVYVANNSHENQIVWNYFYKVKGYPVKLRNGNLFNVIENNLFTKTGTSATAGYVDRPAAGDVVSCGTLFRYNHLDGQYNCTTTLAATYCSDIGGPCPTTAGTCPLPGYTNLKRVSVSANSSTGGNCDGQ